MNKIGWCSETYNPVIGCKNNCSYCYARKINQRFKFIKDWNNPEWKEKSFNKKFPKKPQRIFVGSMSEIYYWQEEWVEKVIEKVKQYPRHTFMFLTKYPQVYLDWEWPKNCWLGVTVTTNIDAEYLSMYCEMGAVKGNIYFYSIEPLLDEINPEFLKGTDWVIIGAETGKRKGKVIPKKEWIESIVKFCQDNDIPVYLKDSLKDIYPVEIKEFPNYK